MAELTQVGLSGVPETLLWTLYHRAVEARRPDAVLEDPMAVELVERLGTVPTLRRNARSGRVRRDRLVDPLACWTSCAWRTCC